MKNITLSAEEQLIEKARKKAKKSDTTLNALFRQWLRGYTRDLTAPAELDSFLAKVDYIDAGRKFSRDELNER